MKKNFIFMIAFTVAVFSLSCSYSPLLEPEVIIPDVISFSEQIEPIFKQCTGCHPNSGGLDLKAGNAYASLTASDKYINFEVPELSLIYTMPHPDGSHPKKYTAQEAALVLKWIEDGALNN
ncbi:MAG: hypothetical protein CVU09_18035 [Bacteroidetes bacterium HGW-Bacteroidetes-4]|jgi:hypothetical protein|nr:MAG: hypothetical protein CVU09_18035 [Bacteroidetes bacterium HGW-Bacteroidetes-4]